MSSLKNLLLRAKRAAKVETFLQKKIVKLKGLMHYFARKKTNFKEFFHNFFFFAKIKMFIKIDKKVRQNEGSLECKQTLTNFSSKKNSDLEPFLAQKFKCFSPKKVNFIWRENPNEFFMVLGMNQSRYIKSRSEEEDLLPHGIFLRS